MHEVSAVSNLVSGILSELARYKVSRVNSVTLVIGDLTSLGEEQMRFAYEIVTRGTVLENSELIIEHEKIVLSCRNCNFRGPARYITDPDFSSESVPILSCPGCGGSAEVVEGQSCTVKYLDIEEEE